MFVYVVYIIYICNMLILKVEVTMKSIMKLLFVLVGLILAGANVYSSQSDNVAERNAEGLSAASTKTGISIVRQENFQVSEAVTTFDEITTCMSGTSQTCNAGTVHVRMSNQ